MSTEGGKVLAVPDQVEKEEEVILSREEDLPAAEAEEMAATPGTTAPGLRRYTAEEDDLILSMWYDKKQREKLAQQLQRPLGGLAYRFYQILKARGIEPADYRREMRAFKRSRQGSPLEVIRRLEQAAMARMAQSGQLKKVWTTADQMNLWRWRRAGESWETIAARLGTTPEDCEAHYRTLLEINAVPAEKSVSSPVPPAGETLKPGPGSLGREDLLEALKYFPDRAEKLERRLEELELKVQELRERNRIELGDLVAGLTRLSEVVAERDQLRLELNQTQEQFRRLEEELSREKEKIQAERAELQAVYQDLNTVLGDFMRLSSVDKLRVLGDFATRLEVTVDRFGSVVRARHTV